MYVFHICEFLTAFRAFHKVVALDRLVAVFLHMCTYLRHIMLSKTIFLRHKNNTLLGNSKKNY